MYQYAIGDETFFGHLFCWMMVGAKSSRLKFAARFYLHDKCKLNVEASCAARANARATAIKPSIRSFQFIRLFGGTTQRPKCHGP